MATLTAPAVQRPDRRPAVRLRLLPSPAEQAARAAGLARAVDMLHDAAAVIRAQSAGNAGLLSLAVLAEVAADGITAPAAAVS